MIIIKSGQTTSNTKTKSKERASKNRNHSSHTYKSLLSPFGQVCSLIEGNVFSVAKYNPACQTLLLKALNTIHNELEIHEKKLTMFQFASINGNINLQKT